MSDVKNGSLAEDPGLTEHQRARKERAERRAARLRAAGEAKIADARAHVAGIPMGQPILVGHHSERRHRRDLEKHDRKMRKGVELLRAAERAESPLAGASISSDDPEALKALRAQLEAARANHELYKRANAAYRKGHKRGGREGAIAAMREAGIADEVIAKGLRNLQLMPVWTVPFLLGNGNAEIKRIEARIAELERRDAEPEREPIVGEGWRIEEDKADNRVRFYFDARPSREVIEELKRNGWRWSRTAGAWQRQLNENGRWSALQMACKLFGYEPPAAA